MTETLKDLEMTRTIILPATASAVWEALTNPELTRKYLYGCAVLSDWQPGSPIIWLGEWLGEEIIQQGTIRRIEPGRLVEYTASDPEAGYRDVDANYLHITYELTPGNGMTSLTVRIDHFGGDEKRYANAVKGWDLVLDRLKKVLANGIIGEE